MKSNQKNIITTEELGFGLIENYKSYWATHFYSILQCLHYHKNLQYHPSNLNTYPLWTLRDLRGHCPPNFFDSIQKYIQNWGFQYFLVSFLNQKLDSDVVLKLIDKIEKIYDVKFSKELDEFSFHISGHDSNISDNLEQQFSGVFPTTLNNMYPNKTDLIKFSDICMILTNSKTMQKVGIFGEIEGLYGNKLLNENYWGRKQDFCIFGIGTLKGTSGKIYFDTIIKNNIHKIILLIEKEHYVIRDFNHTLEVIKYLFLYGPGYNYVSTDEEFNYLLNIIKLNWAFPIPTLLEKLKQFIYSDDVIGLNSHQIQIITNITK